MNKRTGWINVCCLDQEPRPSSAVIDSQSVKATEAGDPLVYDAGMKVMGRKALS